MITAQFLEYLKATAAIENHLRFFPKEFVSDTVVRAWEFGGLLSPQFEEDGRTIKRMWLNVVAHQVAVARTGHAFAKALKDALVEERAHVGVIVLACLVHDATKRREQDIRDSATRRGQDDAVAVRELERSKEFLLEIGFTEEIADLASYTGNRGFEDLLAGNGTLTQKIVFYSDCVVSNYDIVGYKKRFDDVLPHFEPGGRYHGEQQSYIRRYNRTHREMWDSVVIPLQEFFAKLLRHHDSVDTLPLTLTAEVQALNP